MDIFAESAAALTHPTVIATVVSSVTAAVAAAWAWFRSELTECKKDRRELFARVEQLHAEILKLSVRVGRVEHQVPEE